MARMPSECADACRALIVDHRTRGLCELKWWIGLMTLR
jgi:hypothetical protein